MQSAASSNISAIKQVNTRLASIRLEQQQGVESSGFLATLYASQKIRTEEIYANVAELLAAAVETVCTTTSIKLVSLIDNQLLPTSLLINVPVHALLPVHRPLLVMYRQLALNTNATGHAHMRCY